MAQEGPRTARREQDASYEQEEVESLLSASSSPTPSDELVILNQSPSPPSPSTKPNAPQRQSSFAQQRPSGTPRTPNRVRFEIGDGIPPATSNGHPHPAWMDEEDYMGNEDGSVPTEGRAGQRIPLLTDIEAPAVTFAMDFDPEDHLENARPRSNMRSAFMNMANSIM
jgi:solute carrier family 38 (sodium-coupled neutral amino acid transporter), member 11